MSVESVVKEAGGHYNLGDLKSAETTLRSFLNQVPRSTWVTDHARAFLWLGHVLRVQGNYSDAQEVVLELAEEEKCNRYIRANALVELAECHECLHEYQMMSRRLEDVESLMDPHLEPGENIDHDKTMVLYLTTRSLLELREERPHDALGSLETVHEHLVAVSRVEDCPDRYIMLYLNYYNCHMILGDIEHARKYLLLAKKGLEDLGSPFAIGLVHFFENLATYNLFALESPNKTIEALTNISEKVIKNFADFHKTFDFFSSIIVQLRDEKIDMDQIRDHMKGYGDDPLIKAYLPVLLAKYPPPKGHSPGDVPTSGLTD